MQSKIELSILNNFFSMLYYLLQKREYPDGTVKILYDDGRCETRYTSGRIRIKDGDGKLLQDSINNGGGAAKSMQIKV